MRREDAKGAKTPRTAELQELLEAVGHTSNAVLEQRNVEVDEKSQAVAAEAEVGEQLRLVDRQEPSYRLQLDHDYTVDDDVEPVG